MPETLVQRVAEIIHRYSMLPPGERVGVAVSGGADSVVLLHILHRLAQQHRTELLVLHVNHHLRGVESDLDESFVRSLAGSLNLPFIGGSSQLGTANLEAEARQARRAFYAHCRDAHRLTHVALGHTKSDQAETVLHRFLRGTGSTGLAAMRLVSTDGLLRPLLTTSQEEIREFAVKEGIHWREDSSNADLRFTRNRLRQTTIPTLKKDYNEHLEATLAHTALLAQGEEDYWFQEVERLYALFAKRTRLGSIFQIDHLISLPIALRRRLIRRALELIRPRGLAGLDFSHIEAVLALCESVQGHDRVLLPDADAIRSFNSLLLTRAGRMAEEPRGYRIPVSVGVRCILPFELGQIYIDWVERVPSLCDKFKTDQEFSANHVHLDSVRLGDDPLLVRNWEPGDELHRAGHKSAEKIKKLFQEHRVLLWERKHWPVLVCGKEIVWARGFGVAKKFALAGQSHGSLELIYQGEECAAGKGVL